MVLSMLWGSVLGTPGYPIRFDAEILCTANADLAVDVAPNPVFAITFSFFVCHRRKMHNINRIITAFIFMLAERIDYNTKK